MSKQSWKDEFYPKEAWRVSKNDALKHSLKKWKGALPANLKKHELAWVPIPFNSETCALCSHFCDISCDKCPLAMSRDGVDCTEKKPEERESPYDAWKLLGRASPMIRALQKAVKYKKGGNT